MGKVKLPVGNFCDSGQRCVVLKDAKYIYINKYDQSSKLGTFRDTLAITCARTRVEHKAILREPHRLTQKSTLSAENRSHF